MSKSAVKELQKQDSKLSMRPHPGGFDFPRAGRQMDLEKAPFFHDPDLIARGQTPPGKVGDHLADTLAGGTHPIESDFVDILVDVQGRPHKNVIVR
jgi:hypothetical protein